jgi:hypothetical protein
MSKRKERTFVIRGFDSAVECFTAPLGTIDGMTTFKEVVIPVKGPRYAGIEAVTTMLVDDVIGTMSVRKVLSRLNAKGASIADARLPENVINVVDLTVNLNTTDKLEVRQTKSALRDIFKHWAEKSRVKNRRGFRSSAIRTPEFVYNPYNTEVKVQVILSNATIYSDSSADVTPQDQASVLADLALLKKELSKRISLVGDVEYNHSLIGKGML